MGIYRIRLLRLCFGITFLHCIIFWNLVAAETTINISKSLLENSILPEKKFTHNLVVFTASYCTICKAEEQRFKSLKELFLKHNIRILFAYIDKLPENSNQDEFGVKTFLDKDNKLENTLNPSSLPSAFLLDSNLNPIYKKNDQDKVEYIEITVESDGLFSTKNINKILKEKE
jgi:thiol-disulfide isomerase/thioredoxin